MDWSSGSVKSNMHKTFTQKEFRLSVGLWSLVGVFLCCATGCVPITTREIEPLLRKPRMSSDSVVLDVFLVRFPFGDPQMNEAVWSEIDEQAIQADSRRRLLANGFRAGVIVGPMPDVLTEQLELGKSQALPGEINKLSINSLAQTAPVMRGHFQLRAKVRKEICLGQVRDNLQVLLVDAEGNVSGKPYQQAQVLFAVKSFPLNDGRVRLEIVPEIMYGQYRPNWAAEGQGILRLNPGRLSQSFDDLKLETTLAPGNMLTMSTVASRSASLGGQFFTETTGEQVLLLMRLSQTQHDGAFDAPETPPIKEAASASD